MENGHIIRPRRQAPLADYRELATNGSYSVIVVVLALIALRPVMVRHVLSRADAYSAFNLHDETRRQCSKVLLLDNDNSQAWCQLARLSMAKGEREMARAAYLKAVRHDPTNKPAHFELAMLYVDDDLYREAIPYFDQVRKLGPDKPEHIRRGGFPYHKSSLDMLATCYEKVGDIAKAEFTLEEIQVFYPNYAQADMRLSELKERHRR